ncbi:integrase [Pseudomonas syringae]|nr:integrase [Pseudomonas syringae]
MNRQCAQTLVELVSNRLNSDLEGFPDEIVTVYGQKILTTDSENKWVEHLFFEHIGYIAKKIQWAKRFHDDDYVEWIIRCWITNILEESTHLKIFECVINELPSLNISSTNPEAVEAALFEWAKKAALTGSTKKHPPITSGMKHLYEWCLDEGLPGFSELRQFDLDSIRPKWKRHESAVSLRDFDNGPYTRTEISLIETTMLQPGRTTPTEQAMVLLARDWGLRPIQLALLQTQDFGRDELGPYIYVTSVKGKTKSKLRRIPANMVKRYISDDTAIAIEAQIDIAISSTKSNLSAIRTKIGEKAASALGIPLFPNKFRTEPRLQRLCENPRLVNYALHQDSHRLSVTMKKLTGSLSIPSPRQHKHSDASSILKITAYRFRRTKGTSMVLAGASPEEVAEALDHAGLDSIKFYFRYNLELHDFINRVHSASPEVTTAVNMWHGRIEDVTEVSDGEIIIGSLGKCTLGSACPHHPTVTCYACPSFRPNKSANHLGALQSIQEFQNIIARSSTGPVTQQLEVAIYGAKAVILAIQESLNVDQ